MNFIDIFIAAAFLVFGWIGFRRGILRTVLSIIGLVVGGAAGAVYASQILSIQPEMFNLNLSIMILACVVFGGMGNIWGVILGAVLLGYLPEKLRFLSDYRIVFFGLLMVVMMNLRPNGLLPRKKREVVGEKKK